MSSSPLSTPETPEVNLKFYTTFARRKWPRSYRGKIMLVAFFGTHVPLICLLTLAILQSELTTQVKTQVLLTALAATLVGTAATLYLINRLLAPVILVAQSLRRYLQHKQLPNLPTQFQDEAGTLMADTMQAVGQLDDTIEYLQGYDVLTGLPNRERFREEVTLEVAKAARQNLGLAVLIVDIDDFSSINTTFGQSQGDQLLREAARRLQECVRETDFLSRIGGGQFALLHYDINSPEDLVKQSERVREAMKQPFFLNGKEVHATASVGVAQFPDDDPEGTHLLENAESALRIAKGIGGNSSQFFAAESNAKLRERLQLGNDLHGALERNEFLLYYQPQVDSQSGSITGVEALLRWHHPTRGFIPPSDFIPIAEATGLIVPLGEWVLRTACAQNKAWQDAGLPPCLMAVNLSARQFTQPNLVETVVSILQETGLEPKYLELEVTESMMMTDVERAIGILQALHSHGIELSLDDFGTGYSSLSYLKRFPLHALKIDRSFVRDLADDSEDAVITASIIGLAKNLGLSVIAEGVETPAQSTYLQEQGCHNLQGYLFSRPVAAEQCAQYMAHRAEVGVA